MATLMLRIEQKLYAAEAPRGALRKLRLSYADRCKSRLLVCLEDGAEAGLFLPRGTILRSGDILKSIDGILVAVAAAVEDLYEVTASDTSTNPHFDLLRATYHLGNRHVPVQLAPGLLRLERDAVLRDLLLRLGLVVEEIVAPFEPEAGAYGGGHRHDHDAVGGVLGELLSREAHAATPPDFARASFQAIS
ncbi:MAG: urease accessory protein UreE [Panacagrimonas sp.]